MAVLKVRRYGDPVLRRRAEEIATVTPQIRRLAEDMIDTMYDEVGIGLAAPQIGGRSGSSRSFASRSLSFSCSTWLAGVSVTAG